MNNLLDNQDIDKLEGQTITVERIKGRGASEEYPWSYHPQKMHVDKIYKSYLLVTILPHEHPDGFGMSIPYQTTINKIDIATRSNPEPLGTDAFMICS